MTPFFIFGMFRSGTTALTRALNAHPEIACASDPVGGLFKAFRSQSAASLGLEVPANEPFGDYYFDEAGVKLLAHFWNKANLDIRLSRETLQDLKPGFSNNCAAYSQLLEPHISALEGSSYRELLNCILHKVVCAYGGAQTSAAGIKEVWLNEFSATVLRTFPDAKVIFVCRDPRAVAASKNSRPDKYPWTFLGRQWRKSAALIALLQNDPEFHDRTMLVKYEDFVKDPATETKRICKLLNVDWHPDVADHTRYRDGNGNPWKQNSSFGHGSNKFDEYAISRWQKILSEDEKSLIEYMCAPEMKLLGYPFEKAKLDSVQQTNFSAPHIDENDLAKWTKGILSSSRAFADQCIKQDGVRFKLLESSVVDTHTVDRAFLSRAVFELIRAA